MSQVIAVVGATGTLGRTVVEVARAEGLEVREIARSRGVDIVTGEGLDEALRGVQLVIDCFKPPTLEAEQATEWFHEAMSGLGDAARRAGVTRTVVTSIVGIDGMQDYGFYRAQLAHEQAAREHCPGTVIVRATQFHDFVGNMLVRDGDGDGEGLQVMEAPSQPVDTRAVAALLLRTALAEQPDELLQIAGPQVENTLDQARRLLAARGDATPVTGAPASESMSRGGMLPGPEVPTAGPTYEQWLDEHERHDRTNRTHDPNRTDDTNRTHDTTTGDASRQGGERT
ncbi:SDR family oxidoreductase [Brachybacterium tyrofermentans]|uniref:SDR family oxidoreductase n=1 Tax=Brachybacterium tyrofermentans TaxID=47848 RepID=UPI003FD559C7